jgi:hypothetical protein
VDGKRRRGSEFCSSSSVLIVGSLVFTVTWFWPHNRALWHVAIGAPDAIRDRPKTSAALFSPSCQPHRTEDLISGHCGWRMQGSWMRDDGGEALAELLASAKGASRLFVWRGLRNILRSCSGCRFTSAQSGDGRTDLAPES